MNRLEVIVDPVQRFRLAHKKISVRLQVVEKMLDHLRFGCGVEVDQHVGAEDEIEAFHENHLAVIIEVKPEKGDRLPEFRRKYETIGGCLAEVFLSVEFGRVSDG